MRTLAIIYWLRAALGVVAALFSTILTVYSGVSTGQYVLNAILNGLTIALLVYLISYYVFKARFAAKLEKPSKVMTMGIGIYFFTWIAVWTFFFTIIHGTY
jgi:hypothetical protein